MIIILFYNIITSPSSTTPYGCNTQKGHHNPSQSINSRPELIGERIDDPKPENEELPSFLFPQAVLPNSKIGVVLI